MYFRHARLLLVLVLLTASFSSWATVSLEKYKNTNEVTIKIHHQIIEEDLIEFKNALDTIEKEKKVLHMNVLTQRFLHRLGC